MKDLEKVMEENKMKILKVFFVLLAIFCLSTTIVSAADYGLTSVTGVWTGTNGGSGITGINTNEVRWGTTSGSPKSGMRFDGTSSQSFNEGDTFKIGQLTHLNYPVDANSAADGATLKVTMSFSTPAVSPDPEFTYEFAIEETSNSAGHCPTWQVSSTPCDDRITFPSNYGEEAYTIGDKLYTLKILGFVNAYPSGTPVSYFITEEQKDNTAYLVGTLSSVLVDKAQITLVSKNINGQTKDSAPGLTLYVGDPITWEYVVQNTGNVALTDVSVSDDKETVECPKTTLAAGEAMTCTASGTAELGQYENTATAYGKHVSSTLSSDNKVSYYLGINLPVCGDGVINQQSEECEMANTIDNTNCPQSATGCQDNKLGTRDGFGECNLNCLCAPDSFENFQCVKDQCGAECDSSDDCDDGDVHTIDGCLANCMCGHETQAYCGDGNVDAGEQCDGSAPAHYTCNNCALVYIPYCGDVTVNGNEECDGSAPIACDANGYAGLKTCTGCMWSECVPTENCGDGIINDGEQCDTTAPEHYTCSGTCTLVYVPYCGDGNVDAGEQCDGTAGVGEHQTCNVDCHLVDLPYCGDKTCNGDETCSTCEADCGTCPVQPFCGDGNLGTNEQCDDGSNNGKGCSPLCGEQCNYCGNDCTTKTNTGSSCPSYCDLHPTDPQCGGNPGVPEFSLITIGLAVIGVGLGLAFLRKKE